MNFDVSLFVLGIIRKVNDLPKKYYNALYCVAKCPNLGYIYCVTSYKQCLSYHESKSFLSNL